MNKMTAVVLFFVLSVVLASILLPNTAIAWMRDHWPWFNRPMLAIERIDSAVNLVHGLLFALLGAGARMAMPRWRLPHVALAFLLFGIATELLQFFIPGRHPRFSDVAVDLVAGVLGWAAMRGVGRLA